MTSGNSGQKIDTLFIRMDRMGDLILTLPVDTAEAFANRSTHWFITKGLGFVLEHALPERSYTSFDKAFSWRQLWQMVKWLRQNRPQSAVVFHAPWWVGLALFLARVPVRVGRLSRWDSFLFFNKGLRQSRSQSEEHELVYNRQLAEHLVGQPVNCEPLRMFHGSADAAVKRLGLDSTGYYVVHPGMGGSALNWPSEHYISLVKRLSSQAKVVITGTAGDRKYIEPLRARLGGSQQVVWLNEQLSGPELIAVLQAARAVVAPSTGVVHIAASVGAPTVGLYSPIRAELASRWGPLGAKVRVLQPNVDVASEHSPEVMQQIAVENVVDALAELEGGR